MLTTTVLSATRWRQSTWSIGATTFRPGCVGVRGWVSEGGPRARDRRPGELRPPSAGLIHRFGHVRDHDRWEPLLAVAGDEKAKFNRCEYLRIVPATAPEHERLDEMRQDTESLGAQLERAFYGQRLPAWGVHNQTVVVLMAAFAENAWARACGPMSSQNSTRVETRSLGRFAVRTGLATSLARGRPCPLSVPPFGGTEAGSPKLRTVPEIGNHRDEGPAGFPQASPHVPPQ